MRDPNQEAEPATELSPLRQADLDSGTEPKPPRPPEPPPEPQPQPIEPPVPPSPESLRAARGLQAWLLIVALSSGAALLLGQLEMAGLAALAGVAIAAHAADIHPRWRSLYGALAWVVPAAGAMSFGSLALVFEQTSGRAPPAWWPWACGLGAVLSLLTAPRPVAARAVALLFPAQSSSHVLRLTARLVVIGAIFCIPAAYAFRQAPDLLLANGELLGTRTLWTALVGMVLLALAGVGFLVRRDLPGTLARLGVEPMRPGHLLLVPIGVAALYLLNGAAETVQRLWMSRQWFIDQQINNALAGSLSPAQMLLLGLSAGIGEELVLRGAVQPRLGLLRTSAFFALLHVQYSWFGMLIIAALGLMLGWIRQRANTTTAIAVHALYDVVAAITVQLSRDLA